MNNNFEELDRIAILLGVNEKEYFEAKNDYLNDINSAMQKYFGYIDEEILTYLDFWYYYLADNTNCYFHNFGSTGYTKSISEYIKRNNIKVKDMDYNVFAEKESLYNETLFDILLSEINYNFYDEDYEIFGINVAGYKSNIYYIAPKEVLKQVKNNKINSIEIFDFQKLEQIYGEIYKVVDKINGVDVVNVGDFLEYDENTKIYSTLYNPYVKKNCDITNIPRECLELVL